MAMSAWCQLSSSVGRFPVLLPSHRLSQLGVVSKFPQDVDLPDHLVHVIDEDDEQQRPQHAALWLWHAWQHLLPWWKFSIQDNSLSPALQPALYTLMHDEIRKIITFLDTVDCWIYREKGVYVIVFFHYEKSTSEKLILKILKIL
jgi:hypothetical protein